MHRLALALSRSVDELLDGMSWQELERWGKYYAIEPWGESRADARSAQVASMIANVNRDPKKRPQPYTIKEFMLFKEEEQKEETPQEEKSNDGGGEETKAGGAKIDPTLMAWLWMKARAVPPPKAM